MEFKQEKIDLLRDLADAIENGWPILYNDRPIIDMDEDGSPLLAGKLWRYDVVKPTPGAQNG